MVAPVPALLPKQDSRVSSPQLVEGNLFHEHAGNSF